MHPRSYRLAFPEPAEKFPRPETTPSVLRVRPASPPPKGPDSQTAFDLTPRELWIAAHVPQLALLALRAPAQSLPLVVLDEAHNPRIIALDSKAEAAGVRLGMTLGAAFAAVPRIDARPRDAARELELMRRLAGIATTFTPQVSIEAPDGLLLEIKSSIRLFGGLRELCRQLRDACRADPVFLQIQAQPHFTLAPTALAALVAARAGARCFITNPQCCRRGSNRLPLATLRWPEEANARLAAMGVRTLGELMRLPRAGFAKRFWTFPTGRSRPVVGQTCGSAPALTGRERYRGRLDLDHEIEAHDFILRALQPLLDELEQFLRVRQRGITALQCRFHHYRAAPTRCTLRWPGPKRAPQALPNCCANVWQRWSLPEPVQRCELRSGTLTDRLVASSSLWSPGELGHAPAGEMPALVEHLRARLGADAVYGIGRVPEHRPEHAWRGGRAGGTGHRIRAAPG
jgi:protein ImuB